MAIARAEPTNDAGARNRGVDNGDDISEFTLECRLGLEMSDDCEEATVRGSTHVKVCRTADRGQAIAVGRFRRTESMREVWSYLFVSFEKTPMSLLFSYCKPAKGLVCVLTEVLAGYLRTAMMYEKKNDLEDFGVEPVVRWGEDGVRTGTGTR